MNTREIIEMSSAHLMRNYGRLPLALARGAGSYVWDAEGKKIPGLRGRNSCKFVRALSSEGRERPFVPPPIRCCTAQTCIT